MPRNPAAKKNQHNNRHENGLVGPGKRVTKQKSNGHLNGNVKPALPDEPVPTASNLDSYSSSSTAISSAYTASANYETPANLTKRHSDSSIEDHDQNWENTNGSASTTPRRPEMAHIKTKSSQEVNAVQIASTILKSCPAGDTVSLLIALLALPSMILTIVQALFASLTLMPPTNVSPVSFLSLFDVFQGSAGSPSLWTMAAVDVMCFALWMCLWNWAQNFALDLAQIQIAMTLGNGNSGKTGGVNFFCLSVVLVLHSIRSSGVRFFFLDKMVPASLWSHPTFNQIVSYLPSQADFGESPGSPSKIRSLFAIHILSQALMALVRRKIAGTQSGSTTKSIKRTETEVNAGPSNLPEPLDLDSTRATTTGTDYQAPPTPGLKDSKDKSISAKKRRKQANQVRSRQQPFWAALARTKVQVLREVEHNGGQSGLEGHAPDVQISSPSSQQQQPLENVWVTNVEPSTIEFEATLSSVAERDSEAGCSDSQPLSVRINSARWSVTLEPLEEESPAYSRWCGTISGLAPDCTYTCSFSRGDDEEFAAIMIKTPALQNRDTPPSATPAPPRASLRPHSPTSTLRNSIQSAESKLSEARSRLAKAKRAHKGGAFRLEKEIDAFTSRLKSSSDDNRQRQKLLQAERSIQQTEATTKEITELLNELEAVPEDDLADYETKKAKFEEKNKILTTVNDALTAARSEAKNELSCVNSELNQITSRKERLQGRQSKLAEQHDRITQANAQGMNEKERKAQESTRIETERRRREADLSEGINQMYGELREVQVRTQNYWRELDTLERQAQAQRESLLKNSGPLTPEGTLPGTNPPQSRSYMFGGYQPSSLATTETQSSPFLAFAKTLPSDARRPRSDTNRSLGGISNFSADAFEDADPIPPMPSTMSYEPSGLNGRKGSGSSRDKNNGSPAGVIGDGIRSPHKGSPAPGNMQGTGTW